MANSQQQTVLVTGSAGRLGRAAVAALVRAGHTVRGYDLHPTPGLPDGQFQVGNLDRTDLLAQAMQNCDAVIHLAATPDDAQYPRMPDPEGYDRFESDLVPNNIVGPYRLLELARQLAIPKLILASTGQVIDGHLREQNVPVTRSVPVKPRYLYACTKVFLEAMGQVYAKEHGLTVLAVRIGWCPRDPGQVAEIRASRLAQDVYLSPNDAGRFFVAAVEAGLPQGYHLVYVTSRFTHILQYDLGPAERLLGYTPQEQWPTGAEDF